MALPEDLKQLASKVSNWGRWGDDDQLGTLNLLTPEARRRGAGAVRQGKSFALALRLDHRGPQTGGIPGRINPVHTMTTINKSYTGDTGDYTDSDDMVVMSMQGATHWDSLAHVSYDGLLYNGFSTDTITAERGASRCGIHRVPPVVGRGVLLDVARSEGVDRLEPGFAITPEHLDAAVALAGVAVEPGDIVLVRTGQIQVHLAAQSAADNDAYRTQTSGLSWKSIPWFRDHDVAALAIDTLPLELFGERADAFLPVHMIHLRDMGLFQGQNWNLEELAADCGADGQYDFLLSATPLSITGALGSPVTPVATK